MAVVTPLNNPGGPEGDTVTVPYPLLSPKSGVRSGSVVAREGNQRGCKLEARPADRVGESVTERIMISYNTYPWGLGMSRGDGECYGTRTLKES